MKRLDKYLCDCGAGTRSQVKQLLKAGRIQIDGILERDGSAKIDPALQEIRLDGNLMHAVGRVVLLLNKPSGYVTATEDSHQATVMDLLPPELKRMDLKPIGRLDKDTEGLLLFTNDGTLLHHLISPSHEIAKVYLAEHTGVACEADILAFQEGLVLADGTHCRSAVLAPLSPGVCQVTVCEGKYHQVRRMMASRGLPVTHLTRIQEGPLLLGELPSGAVRLLREEEIATLEA